MRYECSHREAGNKAEKKWYGEIRNLKIGEDHHEMDVTGRGSCFHIIFGTSERGGYLCIPKWEVGCELASYRDLFWNEERLRRQLGKVDAITVATAIKYAAALLEKTVV